VAGVAVDDGGGVAAVAAVGDAAVVDVVDVDDGGGAVVVGPLPIFCTSSANSASRLLMPKSASTLSSSSPG